MESREQTDRQDGIAKGREWQEVRSRLQRRGDEMRKHRVLTAYQKPQKAACDEGKQWREVRLAPFSVYIKRRMSRHRALSLSVCMRSQVSSMSFTASIHASRCQIRFGRCFSSLPE